MIWLRLLKCLFFYGICIGAVFGQPAVQQNTQALKDSVINPQETKSDSGIHRDSLLTKKVLSQIDSSFIIEYIAHPILGVITWPIEKFFVPAIKTSLYPLKPPLRYMLREKVLDKTKELISFGEDDQILVYPIVIITTGTGSQTGLVYIHNFSINQTKYRLSSKYRFFVNGNQKFQTRLNLSNVMGTPYGINFMHRIVLNKNQGFTPPNAPLDSSNEYSDTTWMVSAGIKVPLFEKFVFSPYALFQNRKFNQPPLQSKTIKCGGYFFESENCIEERGLDQTISGVSYYSLISRNTVNNENIPTNGSNFEFYSVYHNVSHNHDYFDWSVRYTSYLFLGVERYEISPSEQKEMGDINFDKIKKVLKYKNLKSQIFNRKVIATQIYFGQTHDLPGNTTPLYGLKTMGNLTPLRGHSGSPFRDYAMAAFSMEYRFPIMRLMEGTMFNEYGIVGKSLANLDPKQLQKSWGLGVRLSRKDIFLFRAQIGFHEWGLPLLNLTIDTVY